MRLAAVKTRLDWWDAESVRIQQWRDETGYTAAIAASEALDEQVYHIEKTILATPATALAGATGTQS
jgi:hypothetical protein